MALTGMVYTSVMQLYAYYADIKQCILVLNLTRIGLDQANIILLETHFTKVLWIM